MLISSAGLWAANCHLCRFQRGTISHLYWFQLVAYEARIMHISMGGWWDAICHSWIKMIWSGLYGTFVTYTDFNAWPQGYHLSLMLISCGGLWGAICHLNWLQWVAYGPSIVTLSGCSHNFFCMFCWGFFKRKNCYISWLSKGSFNYSKLLFLISLFLILS